MDMHHDAGPSLFWLILEHPITELVATFLIVFALSFYFGRAITRWSRR